MADRIIKSDSGNDVIIQNNDASRKIEVTNSGDVEVTGDVKTTTVKATNIKANDGTAGLVVADSTGRVTANEKIETDDIIEKTADHGVEIEGVVLKDSEMASGAIGSAVTMTANQAAVKTAINAGGSAPIYAARAWVVFDGTGASSITMNAARNVSGITDNGTGDFTVNFTTAIDDAHYVVSGSVIGSTSGNTYSFIAADGSASKVVGSFRFVLIHHSGSTSDPNVITVVVHK